MRIKLIVAAVLLAACGNPALAEVIPAASQPLQSSSAPLHGIEEDVWHTVQDWAAAWSARDAFSFLAFYAKGFQPEDGSSFADWSSRRRIYFRQIQLVEVSVAFPAVRMIDEKHAKVRFTQSIKTGQIQSLDEKTMSLTKVGGLWMISEEQSLSSRIDPIAHTKVAAAPAPAPAPSSAQSAPVEATSIAPPAQAQQEQPNPEEVWSAVQAWAHAWQAKDASAFFGHYGTRFRPSDGSSLEAWQKRRRDYFAKVKSIQVDLSEQTIALTGAKRAEVRFTQDFRSDVFKEVSRKQLTLENVGGAWQIVTEQADPRLAEYQIAKMEAAKAEAARAEAARAEAARAEAARAEAARAEAARAEAVRAEAVRAEAARAEAARVEAARVEAARAEAARAEAARAEAARVEAARHAEEAARAETAKVEASPGQHIADPTNLGLEAWSAVQSWAHAWSSLNADAFIGHYAPSFAPEDGTSKAAWETRRRDYFARVKYIEVGLDSPVVHLADENHAQIKFAQSFRSDIYRETAREKFLALEKINGRWLIVAEQSDAASTRKATEATRAEAEQIKADAALAKAKAEADTRAAKERAEAARAEVARAEALKAEAAKAKADAAKAKAEADAEMAKARAEIARAEQAKTDAAKAEAAKARADAARAKSEADTEAARRKAADAKAALQARADAAKAKAEATAELARAEQARMDEAKAAKVEPLQEGVEAQATTEAGARATVQADEMPIPNQDVHDAMAGWAKAWAARDVAAYLACYGEHFQPAGGESIAAWEAQRRARIGKAKTIEIGIDGLAVELLDGGYAKARFTQRYRADNYRDVVSKTVILEKTNAGWRIVREEAGTPIKPATARR